LRRVLDVLLLTLNLEAVKGAANIVRVELQSMLLQLREEFVEELILDLESSATAFSLVLSEGLHHAHALVLAERAQLFHAVDFVENGKGGELKSHET